MKAIPQERVSLLQESARGILERFAEVSWQSGGDFGQVESAAHQAIQELRGLMMSAGLQLSAEGDRRTHHCPDCGFALHGWSLSPRRVVTAEGEATYAPIRYRCRWCEEDHYPLEEANGLSGSQFTTGAKSVVAEEGAGKAFGQVSRSLWEERRLPVSPKEVDRTMREVASWREEEEGALVRSAYGKEASRMRAEGSDPLEGAPSLHGFASWPRGAAALLSVDGGMARSTHKGGEGLEWFECRGGVLRSVGDGAHPTTFYTSGVSTPDALFDRLGAVFRQVVPRGSVSVFVADGSRWIWERVGLYFPEAIQVLDFYHASEHIGRAALAWWGDATAEAVEWRGSARKRLRERGGVSAVIKELVEALRQPQEVASPDALRTELRYLWEHRHRMRYAALTRRGLPIGSGAMESAIKQMMTARLRMPGMKWTKDGADAVLRVRAAHLSNSLRLTTGRRRQALQQTVAARYAPPAKMAA